MPQVGCLFPNSKNALIFALVLNFYNFYIQYSVFCSVCVVVFRSGGKTQRAEPSHLRQEDSDAVWNELAYFKNQTRKLSTEK